MRAAAESASSCDALAQAHTSGRSPQHASSCRGWGRPGHRSRVRRRERPRGLARTAGRQRPRALRRRWQSQARCRGGNGYKQHQIVRPLVRAAVRASGSAAGSVTTTAAVVPRAENRAADAALKILPRQPPAALEPGLESAMGSPPVRLWSCWAPDRFVVCACHPSAGQSARLGGPALPRSPRLSLPDDGRGLSPWVGRRCGDGRESRSQAGRDRDCRSRNAANSSERRVAKHCGRAHVTVMVVVGLRGRVA